MRDRAEGGSCLCAASFQKEGKPKKHWIKMTINIMNPATEDGRDRQVSIILFKVTKRWQTQCQRGYRLVVEAMVELWFSSCSCDWKKKMIIIKAVNVEKTKKISRGGGPRGRQTTASLSWRQNETTT